MQTIQKQTVATWQLKGKLFVNREFLPTSFFHFYNCINHIKGSRADSILEVFYGGEKKYEWWPTLGLINKW